MTNGYRDKLVYIFLQNTIKYNTVGQSCKSYLNMNVSMCQNVDELHNRRFGTKTVG